MRSCLRDLTAQPTRSASITSRTHALDIVLATSRGAEGPGRCPECVVHSAALPDRTGSDRIRTAWLASRSSNTAGRCGRWSGVGWGRRSCWLDGTCICRIGMSVGGCTSGTARQPPNIGGTIVDRRRTADSGVLVVCFRLRVINRAVGHALFRSKRLPNTPLFVGLPRFVSKLWIADDSGGFYRGWYEWDGAAQAEDYVRALWWVLALVSVPGSFHYRILPGLRRDEHQADPVRLYPAVTCGNREWSRLTAVENLLP
jgi:hypothetical protein